MKLFIINVFFAVASLILVNYSPEVYSYNHCLIIALFFVVQNTIYFFAKKEKSLVCFEFFFMIAFGMTNFVYPIFYYTTQPDFLIFSYAFNTNIITKSTSLAYVGYAFYILGITKINTSEENIIEKKNTFSFSDKQFTLLVYMTFTFFLLFFITGGITAMRKVYSGDGDITDVGLFSYFNVLFSVTCTLMVMFLFRENSKRKIVIFGSIISFFLLIMLTTGTRGFIAGIAVIILVSYHEYIKKISNLTLILIVILGAVIMTFIMYARSSSIFDSNWVDVANSNSEITSVFDLFSDLIINNRNLYVLVDFADNINKMYFVNMISDILSPIPGLFRFVISLVDVPKELLTAGGLPTFLEFGAGSSFGLGTNLVGEAYVSFGLFGIVFFFTLIGYIVKTSRLASEYNVYAYITYYTFISLVISYSRAPILVFTRPLMWGIFLMYVLRLIDKQLQKPKSINKNA